MDTDPDVILLWPGKLLFPPVINRVIMDIRGLFDTESLRGDPMADKNYPKSPPRRKKSPFTPDKDEKKSERRAKRREQKRQQRISRRRAGQG